MSLCHRCVLILLTPILLLIFVFTNSIVVGRPVVQYLLFQILVGTTEPNSGVYHRGMLKPQILEVARHIADTLRTEPNAATRFLGFSIGPIAIDQGAADAGSVIRDAFDVALETDMAVALHLEDYMFSAEARWPDGRLLRADPSTTEWKDWSGTSAEGLDISWLPGVKLAPQLCYESPQVKDFVNYWTKEVIGREVKKQFDRLVQAGKPQLFAGVIAGWESNLSDGYCSLSHLGYSAQKPPTDFDHERERVLHRHIELWAKNLNDSGIPRDLIFTHIAPMPRRDYEKISAALSRERIREMPQSTVFRAYWTAFNDYSSPGFSAYVDKERFADIYEALRAHRAAAWAMAEGTNVVLGPSYPGGVGPSSLPWETYLAASFNHGARLVNLFGGFQGPQLGLFQRTTESEEALSAYRKFLRGDTLVEDTAQ